MKIIFYYFFIISNFMIFNNINQLYYGKESDFT